MGWLLRIGLFSVVLGWLVASVGLCLCDLEVVFVVCGRLVVGCGWICGWVYLWLLVLT